MSFPNAWRPQKADVVGLLYPSHITQAKQLLFGNTPLKAKVKGVQRFVSGEIGSTPSENGLLFSATMLLLCKEKFNTFKWRQFVLS